MMTFKTQCTPGGEGDGQKGDLECPGGAQGCLGDQAGVPRSRRRASARR